MTKILLSNRARKTPASPIRNLSRFAGTAKAAGTKVFHLNIGQPDIETPKEFFDGVHEFDSKIVAYADSFGNEALRQVWTEKVSKQCSLDMKPDNMLITTGASEALIFSFMTCCDPGDEVIIFDPTYANYLGFAAIAGVDLVPVITRMKENFCLPAQEEIEAKISNRTRAILISNPNNPTGTVYSKEEIQMLLDICNQRNFFLLVDETYREFVYDGLEPFSALNLSGQNPRVIIIDSLSKRFNLCGARIGCLITYNQEFLTECWKIAQARLSSPTIEQAAAAVMLERISDSYVAEAKERYTFRRDTLIESLSKINSLRTCRPQGAFYCLVELPIESSQNFCKFMLTEYSDSNETIFLAPANGFYINAELGENRVRIAYVLNRKDLQRAVEILGQGLKAYRSA